MLSQTQDTFGGGAKEKNKNNMFAYKICGEEHLTPECPWMDEIHRYFLQWNPACQPTILTNPFIV